MKKYILVGCLMILSLLIGCRVGVVNTTTAVAVDDCEPTVVIPTPTPTQTVEVESVVTEDVPEEPQYKIEIVESEAVALAQMAWGEAGACPTMEIAATMWTVLNRVDTESYGMGNSVNYVLTFPNQFHGYSPSHPVTGELYDLAVDVLTRWQMEKQGASAEEVGRVLPKEYLYFHGDGQKNWFRTTYKSTGEYWDWSLPNPYVEAE